MSEDAQHRRRSIDDEPEPSRKRRREGSASGPMNGADALEGSRAHQAAQPRRHAPPPAPRRVGQNTPIAPSIFGIAPRNEFTKTVGEFIMDACRDKQNLEIEIKLGILHAPGSGNPNRLRLPTRTETIVPFDCPTGRFASTMTKAEHASLNRLLNSAVQGSHGSPSPIAFSRSVLEDSFYNSPKGKVRVTRDEHGNVVEGGVVRKQRVGDLNISSPREVYDWRVSVSVEQPVELPDGPSTHIREKNRLCYRHQLCQVDLTLVAAKENKNSEPRISYELEIEILDVPALVEEGEKEERGEPNRFDEMLQSVLDTARMLIRNV